MTDKKIIYNCPHISLTDWGTYACKLYNPRDKNCIVSGGNCASNTNCPYKQTFEKDIDVPSKNIVYTQDAKDCEQYCSDNTCCTCRNREWHRLYEDYKRKEQECEKLKQGYAELTNIVAPYMDDFTGYNEELGGFDIVLCVKQLLEQLDQLKSENEDLKKSILQECPNCGEEYLNYKGVELYYENNDLKQTLIEIKKIAEGVKGYDPLAKQILQKISEVQDGV